MLYKLESLRGVAAVLVVLYHTAYNFYDKKSVFVESSWLFVDFFFVLSGFVMTLAYADKIKQGLSFSGYIIPRFFRLYPLHLAMVLAWVPFIVFKLYLYRSGYGGTDPLLTENLTTLFGSLFMLNSVGFQGWNGPSWSISAEWWTYIAFFFLLAFTGKLKRVGWLMVLIAVFIYALTAWIRGPFVPLTNDFGILRCIPAFLLGSAAYHLFGQGWQSKGAVHEWLSSIALIVSICLSTYSYWCCYLAVASFIYVILAFSTSENTVLGKLLLSTPLKLLGLYSYSIYLVHMIIVVAVGDVLEHVFNLPSSSITGWMSVLLNTALIIITIITAHFTYRWIEAPGKRYGKKIAARLQSSDISTSKVL